MDRFEFDAPAWQRRLANAHRGIPPEASENLALPRWRAHRVRVWFGQEPERSQLRANKGVSCRSNLLPLGFRTPSSLRTVIPTQGKPDIPRSSFLCIMPPWDI